jgi:predicted Zn-dependent protease
MKNVRPITIAVLLALSVPAFAVAAPPVRHAAPPAPAADYYANLQSPLPWHGTAFPLRVYIYPGSVEGYKLEFQDILEGCFKEWTEATGGRVTFNFVTRPADADIEVEWHRHLPVQSHEIGHTAITEDGNYLTKARVMLLTFNTSNKPLRNEQIKQACLHEIGHALGIKGHSQNPKDIMFVPYNFHYKRLPDGELELVGPPPALTDRDIKTALRIYNDRWLASKGQTPKIAPTTGGAGKLDPVVAGAMPAPAAAGGSPSTMPTGSASSSGSSSPASSTASTSAKSPVPNTFLPPRSTSSKPDTKYRSLVKSGIEAIKRDDCEQAISLLNDALKLGDGSKMAEMNLIIALTKKANKSYAQRNYLEAADNYKSALVLRKQVYGGSDPKIAETMPAFSYSLKKLGREAEAAEFRR